MPKPVTSPDEAAESDVRAAMHLPGAARNWAPRIPVTLPPAAADREDWLARYADSLRQQARPVQAGQVITVSGLTDLAARLIRDTYPDSVHGEGICREAFAGLLAAVSGQDRASVLQVLDRLAPNPDRRTS